MKFKDGFALENCEVEVYVTDRKGVYLHKETEYVSRGTGLSSGAYLDAPPKAKKGFAIVRKNEKWEYIADHRDETVYSTTDGSTVKVQEIGNYPANTTTDPRPSEYHTWWQGKWHLSKDAQAKQLQDTREQLLIVAAQQAQAIIDGVVKANTIPDFERQSWAIQAAEANAWAKDKSTPTPTLEKIALSRDVNLDELRQRALRKSLIYQALVASISGQRQKIEDEIMAANSMKVLANIDISYQIEKL